MVERDYAKKALTTEELETIFGDDDPAQFLNKRHAIYKERGLATKLPERAELFAMISAEPNLLRRPIVREGAQLLIGFDQASWQEKL